MASFNEEEVQGPAHKDPGTEDLSVSSVDKPATSKSVVHIVVHANKGQYSGTRFHHQGIWNVIVISQAFSRNIELWAHLVTRIEWLL